MYADIGLQSSIEESEQIDGDNIFPGRFALQSSIEESERASSGTFGSWVTRYNRP